MLFSSITFIYYFLPCVLLVYFMLPRKWKNAVLLISSLAFYAWGGMSFAGLMLIMIAISWIFSLLIERVRGQKWEKPLFFAAIGLNVAVLAYFKFAADIFPVGISFYTFQIMSYIVDVYRGEVAAQRNLATFATYASMFPQLVAGPIVRYSDVERQLEERTHSTAMAAEGIRRFVIGLSKKVILANPFGEFCNIFRSCGEKSVLFYWLYAIAFMLHIYFDFSGYSDMAIGLGKMFGFDYIENFNYPYISKSITEFWRRWHMSLGSWFRDYVYIPMGGNRVSRNRWFFNIFVVWLLTGLWHGGAWNFVLWGLMFAVLLVIEKMYLLKHLEKCPAFSHIYVLFWVMVSFVIFNATDVKEAFLYLGCMMGGGDIPLVSAPALYYLRSYLLLFIIGIIGSTPLPKKVVTSVKERLPICLETAFYAFLLLLVTAYLVDGSFNPFLYFRF